MKLTDKLNAPLNYTVMYTMEK